MNPKSEGSPDGLSAKVWQNEYLYFRWKVEGLKPGEKIGPFDREFRSFGTGTSLEDARMKARSSLRQIREHRAAIKARPEPEVIYE